MADRVSNAILLATMRRSNSPTRIGRGVSEPTFLRKTSRESVIQWASGGSAPRRAVWRILAIARRRRVVTARRVTRRASRKCSGRAPDGPAPLRGGNRTPRKATPRKDSVPDPDPDPWSTSLESVASVVWSSTYSSRGGQAPDQVPVPGVPAQGSNSLAQNGSAQRR